MTWKELTDKHCNGLRMGCRFYVNIPNKLYLIVEKSGEVEIHFSWVDEDGIAMTIYLGKKTYEQIDKLLEGMKGKAK